MRELDMTVADLAERAGVPFSVVRFSGLSLMKGTRWNDCRWRFTGRLTVSQSYGA
jgi:hypothetical protein